MEEIRVTWVGGLLILMSVLLLLVGGYFYKDYDSLKDKMQIVNTQTVISQITLNEVVARAFVSCGYSIQRENIIVAMPPVTPPVVAEPDSVKE